jgi:hypothetical protein
MIPMSILRRRSRQVAFRLSEDEYTRLRNFCVAVGARSVSDIARTAVFQLTDSGEEEAGVPMGPQMRLLDRRVRELSRKLALLSEWLKSDSAL